MISIDEMLNLTQGQGHKVKGQGQIYNFVNKLVSTFNQWLKINDTYTHDCYRWDIKVELWPKSQGQRSRSNIQFCKKNLVLTIYNKLNIGS